METSEPRTVYSRTSHDWEKQRAHGKLAPKNSITTMETSLNLYVKQRRSQLHVRCAGSTVQIPTSGIGYTAQASVQPGW